MRVLNTQQMREADRRTIDEIGIPSDRADGERRPAGGGGDGSGVRRSRDEPCRRRCADAATTAATASSSRARSCSVASRRRCLLLGSVADVRGDARTNLEVLGRIGLTVVEITNAQEWELHFSEISECELIVDAILGTGFRGQLSGLLETVVADVNGLGVPVVAIDLPTGVSADTARGGRGGHRGVDDGDARRAEDPADPAARRLARRRSGHRRHRHPAADPRGGRRAVPRTADARAHARAGAGARGRFAQGRFRPRARDRRARLAAPARRTWRRSARCDPAPAS